MIDTIISFQALFAVICFFAGALAYPFIPMFIVHFVYRKWVKNLDIKPIRIICLVLLLAFGILGLFYLVYAVLYNLDAFTDAFAFYHP